MAATATATASLDITSLPAGRRFELEVLGFTSGASFDVSREYGTYLRSLMPLLRCQPIGYDPKNPSGGLNRDFFERVKNNIPLAWQRHLSLCIAIGGKADQFHGVDAVFFLTGRAFVTIDISLDPAKDHKADFLLRRAAVDLGTKRVSNGLAREVANMLLERYQLAIKEV